MTEEQLDRNLRSVGYAAFVRNLDLFESTQSAGIAAEMLSARNNWAITGSRTRVSCARRILEAGLKDKALAIIASARNVSEEIASLASKLRRQ